MSITILAPPAHEPVTLEEAKNFIRVEHTHDDAIIPDMIAAARELVEAATSRFLITRTLRETLDDWRIDARGAAHLTSSPVSSILAVRLIAPGGAPLEIDAQQYALDAGGDEPRVIFASSPPAPLRPVAGLEIDMLAGFGDAAAIPHALRQAVLHTVLALYESRAELTAPPPLAQVLCAPFKRLRL